MTLQEGKSEPFTEVASDHRRSLGKNCEAELVTLLCGARLGVVEVWGGGGQQQRGQILFQEWL